MFKKICSILAVICLISSTGCENNSSGDPNDNYTFSDAITVASMSDPITQTKGDWAQINDRGGNYIVMVVDGVKLQRVKSDNTGFYDIDSSEYTIIRPGDQIQFAYTKEEIDYAPRPPIVRPSTIRIMK